MNKCAIFAKNKTEKNMEKTRLKLYEDILNVLNSSNSNIVPPLISNDVKKYYLENKNFFGKNPSEQKLMELNVVDALYFFNCLGNYWFLNTDDMYIILKSDGTYDLMYYERDKSRFINVYDSSFKTEYLENLHKEVLNPKNITDREELVKRSEENFKLFQELFKNKYVIFGGNVSFSAYSNLNIIKSDGRFHFFEDNELSITKFGKNEIMVFAWDEKRRHNVFSSTYKRFNQENVNELCYYFTDGTFREQLHWLFKYGNDINEMFDFMKEKYRQFRGKPSKQTMEEFEKMRQYFLI